MHRTLACFFSRKVKAVLPPPTLPENLKRVSILQPAQSQAQDTTSLATREDRAAKMTLVQPKAVEIKPTGPSQPGQPLPLSTTHPQKYFVKTKLFSNREAKELLENNSIVGKNPYDDLPAQSLPQTPLRLRNDQETKEILAQRHRLYLFYKPRGLICTPTDPTGRNRNSVFWYIENYHNFKEKVYICVV